MTGCCAAVIGLLYPYLDDILGEKRGRKQEWSSVMRCIAVFVGINHASAVSFANNRSLLGIFVVDVTVDNFVATGAVFCYM